MKLPGNQAHPPRCTVHPEQPAGWHCEDCHRALCPACVASTEAGRVSFLSCVDCDGRATVLMVPGHSETFGALVLQSLRMPVGASTLYLVLGAWWLVHLVRSGGHGVGAWLLYAVLMMVSWLLYVSVLQLAAQGPELLSVRSLDLVPEVALPAARLWTLSALMIAGLSATGAGASRPVTLALVPVAGVLVPLVILCAGRGDRLGKLLQLRTYVTLWRALGRDAVQLASLCALLTACLTWWWAVSRSAAGSEVPLLPMVLDTAVALGLLFSARLLGILASVRADALGVPFRDDLLIPALPGARALGRRRSPAPAEPERPRARFLEL